MTQLLYSCGWVMTPVDEGRGIYEWIHMQGNRRQEIQARSIHMQPNEVIRRKALKVHVTTSVPVQHLNPTNVSDIIRNLAGVNCFPSGQALVLMGYTDSVASALLTLKAIDQPGKAIEESLEARLTDIERNLQSARGRIQQNETRLQSAEKRIETVEKKTSK